MTERSTLDEYVLTAAGWPRPIVNGYPIPWVAPTTNLSEVNEGRRLASLGGAVCQVCGEGFAYGEEAFAFTWADDDDKLEIGQYLSEVRESPAERVYFMDGAVLHFRCAKLTAARCPHIRDATDLICIRVPANDADPTPVEGKFVPTYPAGDVQRVPWPVPR